MYIKRDTPAPLLSAPLALSLCRPKFACSGLDGPH